MIGWLLDTNVLSAFAPGKPFLSRERAEWFRERASALFISSITVMEIDTGVARLRRLGAHRRADILHGWLDGIFDQYADRVLSFDLPAARIAGVLNDAAQARGRHPGLADITIAAIARSRELIVLTVNVRHFEVLGATVHNPFEAA